MLVLIGRDIYVVEQVEEKDKKVKEGMLMMVCGPYVSQYPSL